MPRLYIAVVAASILLACSCSATGSAASSTGPPPDALPAALPPIAALDNLRAVSVDQSAELDMSAAVDSAHASYDAGLNELALDAPAGGIAYAVFSYLPPDGLFAVLAGGSDTLWLLAADYAPGVNRWVLAGQFSGGMAQADYADLGDHTSPCGYAYIAVVAAASDSGVLDGLVALYDAEDPFNLVVEGTALPPTIRLTWAPGLAVSYRVYRSTVPNDPVPYLVATVDDSAPADNTWVEFVPPDPNDSTIWTALNNQNDTPADLTDDFPWIAPAVEYYYTIEGVGGEADGARSAEYSATVPWGTRRSERRELPSSLGRVQVFADQLLPNNMTAAQVQWCAENLCGTQKIFKWQADEFRQYNPDFVVLGYHLGNGAGDIGNVLGNTWDNDADWPYVDAHGGWFITRPSSSQPGGRVLQQDWDWYVADPLANWGGYLAANLLQTMGEDHFDGWFIDSCHDPWNTDPAQWWPDGESQFSWFAGRLQVMLPDICAAAQAHPLQPYIIPNASAMITTLSTMQYYGDSWACDGIMIENYGRWSPGNFYSRSDWELQLQRVLDHQHHGLVVIMQAGVDITNTGDRLFMLATYLLVRGEHTYINWLAWTADSQMGQWFPEWDLESGFLPFGEPSPPDSPLPASLDALHQGGGLYIRNFSAGKAIVNVGDGDATWDAGEWGMWEALSVSGGGNINSDGTTNGTATWTVVTGEQTIAPNSALIVRDNGIG